MKQSELRDERGVRHSGPAQHSPRSPQSDALLSGRERNASGSSHRRRQTLQRREIVRRLYAGPEPANTVARTLKHEKKMSA